MTADSLIEAIHALKPDFKVVGEPLVRLCDVVSIIRQHQVEPPHLINPEEIASCTVLQMHAGQPQQDVVERMQVAYSEASKSSCSRKGMLAAIAAMPLRSVGPSDAKGREEAERPAKEHGVEVPGAAPDTLNAETIELRMDSPELLEIVANVIHDTLFNWRSVAGQEPSPRELAKVSLFAVKANLL